MTHNPIYSVYLLGHNTRSPVGTEGLNELGFIWKIKEIYKVDEVSKK